MRTTMTHAMPAVRMMVYGALLLGAATAHATPGPSDVPAATTPEALVAPLARPDMVSPLAVSLPQPEAARDLTKGGSEDRGIAGLSSERAKILLRSLTLPGWGQASVGRNTSAWVFGLAEVGIWTSFAAFKIQERLRTDAYERTAALFAGIALDGRDEEFRRIVGSFLSSDDYNQFVVFRDAANLFYDDPVAYRAYIAENELKGTDAWSWDSVDALLRYRSQRQREQRASNRANTALALAIGNRILSAIHAARFAGTPQTSARSWELEYVPGGEHASDFRLGVRTRF